MKDCSCGLRNKIEERIKELDERYKTNRSVYIVVRQEELKDLLKI